MDDDEFRRLLDLFPIVRSRHYHDAWDEDKSEVEKQGIGEHCEFWGKIKLVAERKVGATEAERFCKAFQRIHKRLVCEGLSLDAAQKFLNLS
ncbi:uncharacterized protein LOC103928992 isoform X4 [Pyrus x bretschneideri]|uniref:uncharacterized protein LOC103928992 isoform X4 n=1 Tax=Pyrus x bretschneideri TaxID=225117 RepID=UPI00202E7250|nr:uncharacterized protein LOC103928992 isoform X4 [Pyrus x bretschneideri]